MKISKDGQKFLNWAFGKSWKLFVKGTVDNMYLLSEWNRVHGNKYWIDGNELMLDSCFHMVNLYNKEKNGKKTSRS